MQTSELLTIIGWAVAWGAVIGAASLLILKSLRRASFAVQICVVVLAAVAVLTAGMVSAFNAMFISARDLEVMWYVLAVASAVAVSIALVLGSRVSRNAKALVEAARSIGRGEGGKFVAHHRGLDPGALAAADAPGCLDQRLGVPRDPRSEHEGDRNSHGGRHGQDVPHHFEVPGRDEHGIEGADHSGRQDRYGGEHHHTDLDRERGPAQGFQDEQRRGPDQGSPGHGPADDGQEFRGLHRRTPPRRWGPAGTPRPRPFSGRRGGWGRPRSSPAASARAP